MKITSIEASASRTFNHPHERYANFRFSFRFSAQVDEGDDPAAAFNTLRMMAENGAEIHKQDILRELEQEQMRDRLGPEIDHAKQAPERIAAFEKRLATDEGIDDYERKMLQRQIDHCQEQIKNLPELEAQLAAIPAPRLLPLPELHPGHPDHPETNDQE